VSLACISSASANPSVASFVLVLRKVGNYVIVSNEPFSLSNLLRIFAVLYSTLGWCGSGCSVRRHRTSTSPAILWTLRLTGAGMFFICLCTFLRLIFSFSCPRRSRLTRCWVCSKALTATFIVLLKEPGGDDTFQKRFLHFFDARGQPRLRQMMVVVVVVDSRLLHHPSRRRTISITVVSNNNPNAQR
jgi:hypothetical protein